MKQKYNYHRHTFPIRNIVEPELEVVYGWIDSTGLFGFHKNVNGKWNATDLYTGTCIVTRGTRDVCLDWIYENWERIEAAQQEPFYIQRVLEFRNMLKNGLEELDNE